jgi:DNA polymerase III subunit gamma/tau
MTYQVLARKWRPKSFASLVGQEHVVRALTHALDGGRLHHAYLFTGTRGVGKTTLSRIFAKALNCETGVTSTPCGVCRACREIDEGRFIDYVEMDAASNRGVDEMAALLERAVYAPVDARFKVYMIDEVHMLTNHAFNAMLKTLEEPPAHVKFILATTDPQKIPVTVLSRCLQFNLKQMPAGHIVTHLEHVLGEEQIPFELQALRLLSRAADGSMRDALSLTDQAIAYSSNQITEEAVRGMLGALDQSYLIRLLDALAAGDGPGVLEIADEMALRSLSFSTALQDLAGLLHRIAWAQFAPSSVLDEWPEAADIRRFADSLSAEHVQLFYQIATIGRGELGLAPDEYAGFTMTLLRMLAFEPAGGPRGGAGGASVRAPVAGGARQPVANGVSAKAGEVATASNVRVPVAAAEVQPAAQEVPAKASSPDGQAAPVVQSAPEASALADAAGPGAASGQPEAETAAPGTDAAAVKTRAPKSKPAEAEQATQESAAEPVLENGDAAVDALPSASTPTGATVQIVQPAPAAATETSTLESRTPDTASPPAAQSKPDAPAPAPDVEPAALAAAAQQAAAPSARAPGGASAALDVLRSAGMRVSSDRAGRVASLKPVAAAKPAAPAVQVPVPRRPTAPVESAPKTDAAASNGKTEGRSVAPWEDMPPDDYMPSSAADDYFMSDNGFVPAFENGPDDVRFNDAPAARSAPSSQPADSRPLPPAVPLEALGVPGIPSDWHELAVGLPLKGVAYQLAFNSELTACDAASITLIVTVPQYAESAQVAKLKAALTDKLGRALEVNVSVGPARRTAAAFDAAARAKRQTQAEQEIKQDPFVQSLIREFGGSIVQDSIKPLAPDAGARGAASPN